MTLSSSLRRSRLMTVLFWLTMTALFVVIAKITRSAEWTWRKTAIALVVVFLGGLVVAAVLSAIRTKRGNRKVTLGWTVIGLAFAFSFVTTNIYSHEPMLVTIIFYSVVICGLLIIGRGKKELRSMMAAEGKK
jgi:peptidoglycan/LPS O-acetylase OafA/YrhL